MKLFFTHSALASAAILVAVSALPTTAFAAPTAKNTAKTAAKNSATPDAIAIAKPVAKATRPRQIVIVVADGLSPQLLSFGNDYIKKSLAQDDATALENLKASAKSVVVGANALDSLKGILTAAQKNGYQTGLVTSEDVTKIAPLFYDIPADTSSTRSDVASALVNTKFDFLAGGGRSHFLPKTSAASTRDDSKDLAKQLAAAGGTAAFDVDSLSEEAKGKILALQNDGVLNYPLDVEQENESSFDDLVSLALTNLSSENKPFVLVVHDGFLARALSAKDTPGLAESYHHLDTIIDNLNSRVEDGNGEFGVAILASGATTTPYVTATKLTEINDTFFIVSNLALSYKGAGNKLRGASVETIGDFASDQYKGWKISSSDKTAIADGSLDAEKAIRDSYEPAIAIGYKEVEPTNSLWLSGIAGENISALASLSTQTPLLSTHSADELDAE